MKQAYFKRSFVIVSLVLAGAPGCKTEGATSTKPASANASATSAIAAPKQENLDDAVTKTIAKVKDCKREEGALLVDNCEPLKALSAYEDAYVQDDESDKKRTTLVRTCIASVADDNDNIREAAANCVGDHAEDLAIDDASKRFVLAKCGAEKIAGPRIALASAVSALHPADAGMEPEVVALAKKLRDEDVRAGALEDVLGALVRRDADLSTAAVDLGLDLLTSTNLEYREKGADLLTHAKARSKDACKGLATLAATGKFPWSAAVRSIAKIGSPCQDDLDPVVQTVVLKMGEGDGYDKGFDGRNIVDLEGALDAHLFSPAQRAKMKAAAEAKAKTSKDADLTKLIGELK